jgi:hypothetical protein
MNRIRLAIFSDRAAAEPARQGLAQAGIPAEIHDELQLERLWFVSKSSAGVRLEVPLRHLHRSMQLLLEWDAGQGTLRDAVRCPECRSLRVDFPQFTRKSLFTNLAIGLMAELRLVERQFYCEDCHCMWSKQTGPHRQRSHLAPNYFVEDVEPVTVPQTQETSERKAA